MIHKLDASHECALNNWSTIAQMNECCSQAETHLKEVCRKVLKTLHSNNKNDFEPHEEIGKESWFQFYPHTVRKWNGTNTPLITLGIEDFGVETLLHLGNLRCAAYVYSPYRADKAINDNATDQLALIPPPPGFPLSFDTPNRGYIFRLDLPSLSANDFCNLATLEKYLTDPLLVLMQWYKANEPAILKALKPALTPSVAVAPVNP